MSGKDQSVVSREALMGTGPGKQIIRQGLFKSKGFKLFTRYKEETEAAFPDFAARFARDLAAELEQDQDHAGTQEAFAKEVDEPQMALDPSQIPGVRSRLQEEGAMADRVARILDSNFVKMTFPVFNALFDAAGGDPGLKQDVVEGHILAIDLSEPMDRIVDRDEDLEYLDDYRLLNPYILRLARKKISRGGPEVLASFEEGFADARAGQDLDARLKSDPSSITEEQMAFSYKKYRAVMGTAGRNMALGKRPLGEIFYMGMARAAEGVGCGNEMEDSLRDKAAKIPSWPLYYSMLSGDARRGFELARQKGALYIDEARLAARMLPEGFEHKEFLDFLFLTVEHYNEHWYGRLQKAGIWDELQASLPR